MRKELLIFCSPFLIFVSFCCRIFKHCRSFARSYGYDGAGNTTGELRSLATTQDWFYTYDANGRLASAGYGGIPEADYLYNALGQQVQRTVSPSGSAVVTLSVHDLGGNRIAEYDGSGTLLREYLWLDGRPLAVVEDGNTYWLHWDHIQRPVLATDATGAVVWSARYLPFGGIDEVTADTGVLTQNLRFPGQWFQAETGLHQNWMRDYDPTTGRYLQADPLGLVDGPSVYGYAKQSPGRWIDPEGREGALATLGGVLVLDAVTPEPTDLALPIKALGYCAAAAGAILIDLATASEVCGCDDECEKQREIEETSCYAFANRRGGGRSAKANLKLCMDSARERERQCRRGVPEPERRPLFGVHTPL